MRNFYPQFTDVPWDTFCAGDKHTAGLPTKDYRAFLCDDWNRFVAAQLVFRACVPLFTSHIRT